MESEEFNIGDFVRCIYDIGFEEYLTKGEIYRVEGVYKSMKGYIKVINKKENIRAFPKKWFIKLDKEEKNLKEFKIDRLGWYEDEKGNKWKVVHLFDENSNGDYKYSIVMDKENKNDYVVHNESGYENLEKYFQLIKYIGMELPEKLRKFEFEAYLGEEPKYSSYDLDDPLIDYFGCCTNFSKSKDGVDWDKISKWKVTMEELPCE